MARMAIALHAPKAPPRKSGGDELSGFAYVDPDGKGHLPLKKNGKLDKGHVDAAAARLNQTNFHSADAKEKAEAKIRAAQKHFGEHKESHVATNALVINDASGDGGSGIPDWVMLIPAGTFGTRDGRGPFKVENADQVIAETKAQQLEAGLPFDINHSTDFAAPNGGESPAAGWIKELQAREGAIWGRVEWTALGKESLSKGPNGEPPKYRYISPVFTFNEETGQVQCLLRAGLTNNPNLYDTAVCAREKLMKTKIAEMSKAKPELVKAARTLLRAKKLLGETDFVTVAAMAKGGTPIEQAYTLLKECAEESGISIAHFIDALVDLAKGSPESPDELDEEDLPEGEDAEAEAELTPFETKADKLEEEEGHEAMEANEALAAECRAAAEKTKNPKIAARLQELRSQALERCAQMKTKKSINELHDGEEHEPTDEEMAARCESMAAEHEKAGRSEDAEFMRSLAARHRTAHEEASRELHRKEAEAAAHKEAEAAVNTIKTTVETMTKELGDLKNRDSRERALNTVEKHIREGKLPPAQREWAVSYCMKSPAEYEAFVAKQPVMVSGADGKFTQINSSQVAGEFMSSAEVTVARMLNVKPEAFVAMRKQPLVDRGLHI